jgi:nucleotidyltransferase/DNA polymerase involved in DNA repair
MMPIVVVVVVVVVVFLSVFLSFLSTLKVNKLLAKLGCGLHKPNQQTLVLPAAVPALLNGLAIDRLQGLGGGLGEHVKEVLHKETKQLISLTAAAAAADNGSTAVTDAGDGRVSSTAAASAGASTPPPAAGGAESEDSVTCGMVASMGHERLVNLFGQDRGTYLHRICRGVQDERVLSRSQNKSLSSAKTFYRGTALRTPAQVL